MTDKEISKLAMACADFLKHLYNDRNDWSIPGKHYLAFVRAKKLIMEQQ
jgi:hypothetical protein